MTQMPGEPGSSKLGYVMIALGIFELAIVLWIAWATGLTWVLLLALLTIPNFYFGLQRIRADRGR